MARKLLGARTAAAMRGLLRPQAANQRENSGWTTVGLSPVQRLALSHSTRRTRLPIILL